MIRTAAVLALLVGTPAFAQDADLVGQLVEGYMGCLTGAGNVDATEAALATQGWTRTEDGEDGLIYFAPGVGQDTVGYMADDGSFCHIESLKIDSASASEALQAAVDANGNTWEPSKDDMGCTRYDLDSGVQATITSGGNDPVCGSDTDSAVRFAFE